MWRHDVLSKVQRRINKEEDEDDEEENAFHKEVFLAKIVFFVALRVMESDKDKMKNEGCLWWHRMSVSAMFNNLFIILLIILFINFLATTTTNIIIIMPR